MPPKKSSSSKKSAPAASWYHCEICNVHITNRERETHENVCPINAKTPKTGIEYISDGILYTLTVEQRKFEIAALNDVAEKYVNNLIFISEGAMRLTNLRIGQHVVIEDAALNGTVKEQTKLIRTAWPTPEKFLTTIFVNEDDLNSYWQQLKDKTLKIYALPDNCASPAKLVQLRVINHDTENLKTLQVKDLERILALHLKHLIFSQGSCINFNFFNQQLEFVVTNWTTHNDETTIVEALENLQLNANSNDCYFEVTMGTNLQIELPMTEKQSVDLGQAQHVITKVDVGGFDKQICLIEESMNLALGIKKAPKGIKISRGVLLYGSTGCGKTLICEVMCSAVQQNPTINKVQILKINTCELFSKFLGETEKNLLVYFEKAYTHFPQPTLLIIEDIHNLCPKHETNDVIKRVSVAFLSMLDQLNTKREAQRTFLLATTSQIDDLNSSIRRCGRLDCEFEIGAPSPNERTQILCCLLRKVDHSLSVTDIEEIAQITHGFVGADLANLIYSATLKAVKAGNSNTILSKEHVFNSLTHIKPSAMREVQIENPNVRWSDIGGQDELKLKLKQAIEWPLLHPEKFVRLGIKPPRGILMFGPPGCSKTMIAKALATESQLNFLSIKGPELFSMWVGESERAVREVFRKARQVAPSIVFFDEIDAIGGERNDGGGGSGATVKERVLTQLLTELDGVEVLKNVTIVAATNRPDMIDKALLRPGRIDRIIYVGLPDDAARLEIFKIKLKKMPLAEDVSIDKLVKSTDGYTGAEIQAVCHEAALKTLEESFDAEVVAWQHFEYALNLVRPRTSVELLKLYDEYLKKS